MRKDVVLPRKCVIVAQAGLHALIQVMLVKICCTSFSLPALTQVLLQNKILSLCLHLLLQCQQLCRSVWALACILYFSEMRPEQAYQGALG